MSVRLRLPALGVVLAVQTAGKVAEHLHLDDHERLQLRRGDRRQKRERGGVVPAGIIAVVVVVQPVAAAVVHPPQRPAGEEVVSLLQLSGGERHGFHQASERPAVDGRLTVIPDDVLIADAVGKTAGDVLMIRHDDVGVPGGLRMAAGQREGVEAVIPAPHVVHPVFRHQHALAAQEAARAHQEAPVDEDRQFAHGAVGLGQHREGVAEGAEGCAHVVTGRVEVIHGKNLVPLGLDLEDRKEEARVARKGQP